jgi:predicted SnoaL-like aldol condensation-catalyzing enzyme
MRLMFWTATILRRRRSVAGSFRARWCASYARRRAARARDAERGRGDAKLGKKTLVYLPLEDTMKGNKNIAIVREVLDKGFGDGDLDVVDQYVAADFIEHQDGAQGRGPQALKDIITGLHASFSEMHLHVQDIVAVGDDVWVRSRAHAVNTRPIMGHPGTHKTIEIYVMDQMRLRDGKLVEHWGVADRLRMMEQLDLLPRRERGAA